MRIVRTSVWLTLLALTPLQATAESGVHHQLEVTLEPSSHGIEVVDRIAVSQGTIELEFRLHGGLEIVSVEGGALEESSDVDTDGPVPMREYRARAEQSGQLTLHYRGTIHHPIEREAEEYARSFSSTPGLIGDEGVFLAGSTHWVPSFGDRLVSFQLSVDLPEGWDAVSQGKRTRHALENGRRLVTWDSPEPMDEIYLVAARFVEYSEQAGAVTAQAFLRQADPNLAARYLEATAQYVDMYTRLIGPYPYAKFALVENFWETGYGMPSFTLLGPAVIRLPFILHSSYPHEILHNWWGNSVFVDYESGNWSEGLTAYLADFLVREGQGQGADYRRDTLKRYLNFVRGEKDFPLSEFRVRHSPSTEAVGYGKSLMLWHMLRLELGDELFTRGLQTFYRRHRFQRASFSDLEQSFSQVSERDLSRFFSQWVGRSGAPELEIAGLEAQPSADGFQVRVRVRQRQEEAPYRLRIPLAFTLEGRDRAEMRWLETSEREAVFEETFSERPLLVQVDPAFDLFRRLDRSEIPASLSQLFGAERVTLVLPGEDDVAGPDAWRQLAESWAGGEPQRFRIVGEDGLHELPADRAVWVLGSNNRWTEALGDPLAGLGAGAEGPTLRFGAETANRAGTSFVYVVTHPADPDLALGWVGADLPASLPGLARKLPHYGKYSYLAFEGEEPTNTIKGQWAAVGSPLVGHFDRSGASAAPLPDREPLARPESVFSADRLKAHVRWLTSPEMQGRGVGTEGIERAAEYIAAQFQQAGLEPGGDGGGYFQLLPEEQGPQSVPVRLRNVIGVLPGTNPAWEGQSVVVAAHYDHLGLGFPDVRSGNEGQPHPGADDNASGVAVLLELARLLGGSLEPQRSIVFAAFSGEEWDLRGSRHYVSKTGRWPAEEVLAMINLDSVGHLRDGKILVLGSGSADEWVHINRGIGFTTGIESQSVADDFGSSDQKSFLDAGGPAVQVFTGAHEHYHRPSDTAETLDYEGLVKVATFVREAVLYLSERDRPLTSRLASSSAEESPPAPAPSGSGRRVSLGTLPDFSFPGPGVRIDSVIPGSAAQEAGLQAGDLLLAIDGEQVGDLRGYAQLLRSYSPGDTIRVEVARDGRRLTLEATLKAR